MDQGLDTGDILYQVREAVLPGDTVADLYEKIMIQSVPLVGRLLADAETGTLTRGPRAQRARLITEPFDDLSILLTI